MQSFHHYVQINIEIMMIIKGNWLYLWQHNNENRNKKQKNEYLCKIVFSCSFFGGNIETNNESEIYVVDICDPFCRICSLYIHTCKDWNWRRWFPSGYCHPHTSCSADGLGYGIPDSLLRRYRFHNAKELAIPHSFWFCNGRILAMLLLRLEDWRSQQGCTNR